MSFKLDLKDVDGFVSDLDLFNEKLAKRITSASLTEMASQAATRAKRNVKRDFTLRNKWTLRSIRSTRSSPSRPINNQFALAGSVMPYLALQEKGGRLGRTKQGRRVTTAQGAREGNTAFPRKKLARGRLASRNISLGRAPRVAGSSGRRAFVAVTAARRQRRRFIFLRLKNDRSGIFEIKPKKIVLVHAIVKRNMRIKKKQWLEPAADEARARGPQIFRREIERSVRQHGLFKHGAR